MTSLAANGHMAPLTNGSTASTEPIQLAIPLPNAPGMRIHIHLSILATTLVLFVTSAGGDVSTGTAPMGSFVYAMPDRYNASETMSTVLYNNPSSLDFATRLAKVLARRTGKAVHVGSSVSFESSAQGGTVEEEIEGFKRIVETVMVELLKHADT